MTNHQTPNISRTIQDLFHINKKEYERIINLLPTNTEYNLRTLKSGQHNKKAEEIFSQNGLDSMYDIVDFIHEGGDLEELKQITQGSKSHYESNYKLEKFFKEKEKEADKARKTRQEKRYNDKNQEYNLNTIDHLYGKHSSFTIRENDPNISNLSHGKNDKYDKLPFDNGLMISKESGETIRPSTVLAIATPGIYHPSKIESFVRFMWNTSTLDPVVLPYQGSTLEKMMESIPGQNNTGIITITGFRNEISADVLFEIDYENNIITWETSFAPAIFSMPTFLHNYLVSIRVFNDEQEVEIYKKGELITVPRRYSGIWVVHNGTLFNGIEDTGVAMAHNTNLETGELLVPEEGVDYITTIPFQMTPDYNALGIEKYIEEEYWDEHNDDDNDLY